MICCATKVPTCYRQILCHDPALERGYTGKITVRSHLCLSSKPKSVSYRQIQFGHFSPLSVPSRTLQNMKRH
ncbi:Uncharacterised protein [Vibrio cholerae]|nr:Uncharacterised protein [Vibrio cholerae]